MKYIYYNLIDNIWEKKNLFKFEEFIDIATKLYIYFVSKQWQIIYRTWYNKSQYMSKSYKQCFLCYNQSPWKSVDWQFHPN